MEDNKKGRASSKKAAAKQKPEEAVDTTEQKEFVDKMKKRATVKTYGIDNVTYHALNITIGFHI